MLGGAASGRVTGIDMRLLIAGIIGAIVFFVWGMLAHVALPIGEMGMQVANEQDAALAALQVSANKGEGVYMLPGMAPDKMSDTAAVAAFNEKYKASPYAFVVYAPEGNPAMANMVPNLIKQFVSNLLAALVLAWVLSLGAFAFGQRVMIAGALALFAWFVISVPYWNWYKFPMQFTLEALIEQVVGWLLAGAAMAWWLGRKAH